MKQRKMFKLVPDPEEMKTAKLVFKLMLELKSAHKVSAYQVMNMYKGKNGGEFSRTTVEQIVKNLAYVKADDTLFKYLEAQGAAVAGNPDGKHGLLTYNKRINGKKEKSMSEWIVAVGKHEGIISSSDWFKIQEYLNKNKEKSSPRQGTSKRALLSGLMICGKCGSGTGITSKIIHDTGRIEYYYRCNLKNRAANRCPNRNLNGAKVEEEVINQIKNVDRSALIANYKQAKKEIKDNTINLKEINKIKKQMDKNNTSIKGLIRKLALIDDDLIDMIKSEIDEIKKENAALELQLQELSSSYDNAVELKNDLDILLDRLDNFNKFIDYVEDVETKRDLIASVVEHIVWDCDAEKNLQINYIGSRNKAASGVVNRRLRFGIGSRCNPFQNATFQTNPTYINIPIKKLKNN
jgi:site-specific DNA recombinase